MTPKIVFSFVIIDIAFGLEKDKIWQKEIILY